MRLRLPVSEPHWLPRWPVTMGETVVASGQLHLDSGGDRAASEDELAVYKLTTRHVRGGESTTVGGQCEQWCTPSSPLRF